MTVLRFNAENIALWNFRSPVSYSLSDTEVYAACTRIAPSTHTDATDEISLKTALSIALLLQQRQHAQQCPSRRLRLSFQQSIHFTKQAKSACRGSGGIWALSDWHFVECGPRRLARTSPAAKAGPRDDRPLFRIHRRGHDQEEAAAGGGGRRRMAGRCNLALGYRSRCLANEQRRVGTSSPSPSTNIGDLHGDYRSDWENGDGRPRRGSRQRSL